MVKLFKNPLSSIFTKQQNNILSAASVIMVAVALSRILGLLRDRMLAARFTPDDLGVYYAAFRLPNMIFELLVMGALATAFIPVFTDHIDNKGKAEAYAMANSVINIGLLIFSVVLIPFLFFTDSLSSFLAPGFNSDQIRLMASFTRVMLIAQVFPLIIGNFFTGMLQSFRSFLVPAIAPVVYNLGIILSVLFLSSSIGLYAPVVGVVFGAFLFLVIQIPPIFSYGYRYSFRYSLKDKGTREVAKLMVPRTVGLAVSQVDTTIDLILSTLLGAGAVTVFNFAQHLQQLPIGLFGASIAQATLPSLSSLYARKNLEEFKKIFMSSFSQIMFLVFPLSIMLIVLRIPIVRLVFGASVLFDWDSTVMTGKTLSYFSISLFAQAQIHLLARVFYSLHDTRTPVIIGVVSVVLNTVLSVLFILVFRFEVWSLGLSASVSSIFNMFALLLFLDRRIKEGIIVELLLPSLKIILSGIVTGFALYIPIKLLDQLIFDTSKTFNLLLLTGCSFSIGLAVYFFLSWFLDIPEFAMLKKLAYRVPLFRKGTMLDTTDEIINA